MFLDRLDEESVKEAIKKPLENYQDLHLSDSSIDQIVSLSGGYPYFVQFICREVYDVFIQKIDSGLDPKVPISEIVQKLDIDFFSGRWARATCKML